MERCAARRRPDRPGRARRRRLDEPQAIHNFLVAVERVAAAESVDVRGLKKASEGNRESYYDGEAIENSEEVDDFVAGPALAAGTGWLFAREEMRGQVDYLFVDEARQVSLADALATGTTARSVVLLGDPLQLAQVVQGSHPAGSEVSVLRHLLGEHRTVPEDRGLFLERTYRLHPDVCAYISEAFYEGRLVHDPSTEERTTP